MELTSDEVLDLNSRLDIKTSMYEFALDVVAANSTKPSKSLSEAERQCWYAYMEQSEQIRILLDRIAPETSGNLLTRIETMKGVNSIPRKELAAFCSLPIEPKDIVKNLDKSWAVYAANDSDKTSIYLRIGVQHFKLAFEHDLTEPERLKWYVDMLTLAMNSLKV